MTDHQESQRGLDAQRVLENEAYKAGMLLLRESVIAKWKECPIRDTEGQVLLLQTIRLCDNFEKILSGMIESGKMAQHKINIDNERNESAGRRLMRRVL